MTSFCTKSATNEKQCAESSSSAYKLFAPVPFSKSSEGGAPKAWSSVSFKDRVSLFEKSSSKDSTKPITASSSFKTTTQSGSIPSVTSGDSPVSLAPWRKAKSRPLPGDVVAVPCVPLAVVAPLNSTQPSQGVPRVGTNSGGRACVVEEKLKLRTCKGPEFDSQGSTSANKGSSYSYKEPSGVLKGQVSEESQTRSASQKIVPSTSFLQQDKFVSTQAKQTLQSIKKDSESLRDPSPSINAEDFPTQVTVSSTDLLIKEPTAPKRISRKISDDWFKEAQRSNSTEREGSQGPVWTRERTPLHSHIKKTKDFYDEVIQKNSKRKSVIEKPLPQKGTEATPPTQNCGKEPLLECPSISNSTSITFVLGSKGTECPTDSITPLGIEPSLHTTPQTLRTLHRAKTEPCNESLVSSQSDSSFTNENDQSLALNKSLHCGGGRRNLEGGVMEDGRVLTPHVINQGLQFTSPHYTKTRSLPSAYQKESSTPGRNSTTRTHQKTTVKQEGTIQQHVNGAGNPRKSCSSEEKKHRRFLGGFFRRKKKEIESNSTSSSSTDSDSDGFNPQKRLSRKKNRKNEPKTAGFSPHASSHQSFPHTRVTVSLATDQSNSLPYFPPGNYHSSSNRPYPVISHTGSLGREQPYHPSGHFQNLGIPHLPMQHNQLRRLGASMSHDSLPASTASWNSESAYGSINSTSARSSALGMGPRSVSIDTLSRKGRKEALKSRVERVRSNKYKDSSSDDDKASLSSHYGSESSLSVSSIPGKRSRNARTERYLRRKSHELETLRIESEKDRRNKEAVQARILEIQKSQRSKDKNKWSARLVYQESNEFDSVVLGTPQTNPASTQRVQTRSLVEPIAQNAIVFNDNQPLSSFAQNDIKASLAVPGASYCWNSFQECNSSGYGSIQGNHCASFDSNINKSPSLTNVDVAHKVINSCGIVPPEPPPRDKARILSPREPIRPISYSFESLHRETGQNISKSCISPPSSSASKPRSRNPCLPTNTMNRSLSERHLYRPANQNDRKIKGKFPARPKIEGSPMEKGYSEKILPITCIPPSPSSDYSSYRSEDSPRLPLDTPVQQNTKNTVKPLYSKNCKENGSYKNTEEEGIISIQALPAAASSHLDNNLDSDSSHSSRKGIRNLHSFPSTTQIQQQASPADKEHSPHKIKPEPPKRGSSSLTRGRREFMKKQLQAIDDGNKDFKERQKLLDSLYQKEKDKLQKNKCANFEEALQELEEIYKSLNLNSEDIMEGAEKRDHSSYHQDNWKENSITRDLSGMISDDAIHGRSRSRTPASRRSHTPDKKMDDLHFRRCQLSNRSIPDTKKPVQSTGSYLLVSPAHVTPHDIDHGPSSNVKNQKEPDIIYDDFLYRNMQRANATKVIEPQPPFGIPLGPVTRVPSSDYLHSNIDDQSTRSRNNEPDVVMDDFAFRNLRKDNLSLSNKCLNTSPLDEFIPVSPYPNGSKRHVRSASADRTSHFNAYSKKTEIHTPRKVKNHNKAKKGGAKFYETYKEAMTDSESASFSGMPKRNPSWVERANLDNRWGSFSTSTETLTEISSVRAISQPDIRHAIIHESKSPTGGPDTTLVQTNEEHPKLVRIQSIPNPSDVNKRRPYRPVDVIFNSKPKPFYLSGKNHSEIKDPSNSNPHVDVTKLDDIISSFGNYKEDPDSSSLPIPPKEMPAEQPKENNLTSFENRTANKNEETPEEKKRAVRSSRSPKGVSQRTNSSAPKSSEPNLERSKDLEKRNRRIEYEKQRRASHERKIPKEETPKTKKRDSPVDTKKVNRSVGRSSKPTQGGSKPGKLNKGDVPSKKSPEKKISKSLRQEQEDTSDRDEGPKSSVECHPTGDGGTSTGTQFSPANTRTPRASSEPLSRPSKLKGLPDSHLSSDKMVQEDGISRLTPSRGVMRGDSSEKLNRSDSAQRRDRIQRYKEERRRQMAARYGTANASSSEEEEGLSSSSYRRRRKIKNGAESSSTDVSPGDAKRARENGSTEPRTRRAVGSSSDDARIGGLLSVKELRNAQRKSLTSSFSGLSSAPSREPQNNNFSVNNFNNNSDLANTDEKSKELPASLHQRQPAQEIRADSAESTPSGSDGRSRRRRASTEEKDKSYKRKSHLNRAPSSEEAVYPQDLPPLSYPSDSNEEAPRRRRRRTPVASDGFSGASSCALDQQPLRVPDPLNHVPRTTPPTTPPSPYSSPQPPLQTLTHPPAEAQQTSPESPSYSAASTPKSSLNFSSIAASSQKSPVCDPSGSNRSAPLTLSGVRLRSTQGDQKKSHHRPTFLRKPEIPEVLRPKDGSYVTSPGVVNTPPSSRPGSVILDKPPLVPEGVRPSNFRTSLRKTSDSGTCFLASKREKLDEGIQDPKGLSRLSFIESRSKSEGVAAMDENINKDELSKKDIVDDLDNILSPQETVDNNREEGFDHHIDALTAQARELISRVDMLHNDSHQSPNEASKRAKNVLDECEEYLVHNKESTKRRVPTSTLPDEFINSGADPQALSCSLSASSGLISDTGQKNWSGGPEGNGEKVRRLAIEKDLRRSGERVTFRDRSPSPSFAPNPTVSSGPPYQNDNSDCDLEVSRFENASASVSEDYPQSVVRWHGKCEYYGSPRSPSPENTLPNSAPNSEIEYGSPRARSPSILKRRTSRDDSLSQRSSTPEPHGILKRKPSSKASSTDILDSEPRPILKKKSSAEDLDHFEPKPILKKKSLTDDELETYSDRPKSILKGARSREDLDVSEGVVSPTPILKRHSRDSEEGELRPILKRRETIDGVRLCVQLSDSEGDRESIPGNARVRSDSAPDTGVLLKSHHPPSPSATPSHGILKNKRHSHSPNRIDSSEGELGVVFRSRKSQTNQDLEWDPAPKRSVSPSLGLLTSKKDSSSSERPLSVAERIAGMEALNVQSALSSSLGNLAGARPKVRASSTERPSSPLFNREPRRSSWVSSTFETASKADFGPPVEAINTTLVQSPSRVSQKAAFFAMLEKEKLVQGASPPSNGGQIQTRKERGTRFATQPVTEGEVNEASKMVDSSESASEKEETNNQNTQAKTSCFSPTKQGEVIHLESSVGSRVAMWSKRLEDLKRPQQATRRPRSARYKTQPVTLEEVANASALNSRRAQASAADVDSITKPKSSLGSADSLEKISTDTSQRQATTLSRRLSSNDLDEGYSTFDSRRGILKSEGFRERAKDSPRSILKSAETRKSFSESDHPRGILKAESPSSSAVGSPEHENKPLKSALKKDSSLEDPKESKEIRSILKPQSDTLEPGHSSDSSSEVNHGKCPYESASGSEVTSHTPKQSRTPPSRQDLEAALKKAVPIKAKDDLAEALRQIEPITGGKEEEHLFKGSSSFATETTNGFEEHSGFSYTKEVKSSTINSSTKTFNGECLNLEESFSKHKERFSRTEGSSYPLLIGGIDDLDRADSSSNSSSSSPPDSPKPFASPSKPSSMFPPRTPSSKTANQRSSYLGPDAVDILAESPLFSSRSSALGGTAPMPCKTSRFSDLEVARSCPSSGSRSPTDKNGESQLWSQASSSSKDFDMLDIATEKKPNRPKERPTSLLERVNQLESSSQQWKVRVSQSDAAKFTVAHRMASASASSVPSVVAASSDLVLGLSPSTERKRRSPQLKVFKSKTGTSIPDLLTKSPATARRDINKTLLNSSRENHSEGQTVSVPQLDDESFSSFFSKVTSESRTNFEKQEFNTSDFDHISINTSELLVNRRQIKVARTKQASKNPLKALAAREDVKSEYTEVKLGLGDKELRRMKVQELSKSSSFAMEALAGLAAKENFSSVALKKIDNPVSRELAPYNDVMLIQVKGRRNVQVRLVEPCCASVNAGDDFLLVTSQEVFHYKGEFTNVIERAVASDMASFILQTKDLGVALEGGKAVEVHENSSKLARERFWKLLGGNERSSCQPAGAVAEDECLENALISSNRVYEVNEDSLVPIKDSWGESPKYELLSSDKVYVFDFGSEMYVWAGKRANGEERRWGLSLLKELWQENFDYSDCDINPIFPSQVPNQHNLKGSRPKWGICGKLTENVETILFKEKFLDWPDMAQRSKNIEAKRELDQKNTEILQELEPCNVTEMSETKPPEPDLVLEMCHLGRGLQYYDEEERRLRCIATKDSKIWHVSENEKHLLQPTSFGHFHTDDTYVVRWYYHVTATGRTLKGTPSKHNITGRSRVAYFFWQGKGSSISDKGVSALMTVELDEERGPHIRVIMGSEPPAFLNLFSGGFVIHSGRREDTPKADRWRLFVIRGEEENEAHLVEVDLDAAHMRSRGCLVLLNADLGYVYLWFGCKVLKQIRQIAIKSVKCICDSHGAEVGWKHFPPKLREEYEGAESQAFLKGLGCISPRGYFHSLVDDRRPADWSLRIWRLVATHNSFVANEVVSSYRSSGFSPFPVWQEELYNSSQPALFIVDSGHKVWVWQGWWPDDLQPEDEGSITTGSATLRFNFARRAALKTCLSYSQYKSKRRKAPTFSKAVQKKEEQTGPLCDPQLVVAGMEPLEFTNLFPIWKVHPKVTALQEKEGRWVFGQSYSVSEILQQLSRTRYTIEELRKKPPPDGVDTLRLEKYLSDADFAALLGLDREGFYSLQNWKQIDLKKKAQLF